ncbi:MAG TPA: phytochelatin synthase family protein [Polyangiaceae bacterium]|jgi:glutathione gamma-glutamylcysteinyltransferase
MDQTLYRRPLPADAIAFSSVDGRRVFAEALAAGGLDGYFPLAEQFHTQADPAFCGLGSLVVALNALAIDPGRLWKGPWRWFAEDLLDCCVPLSEIRQRGLDLDELACLARCNGAEVELERAEGSGLEIWRSAIAAAARAETVVVASYDRSVMGQSGSGHFSPVGGYHAQRDLVLILDVARFKYPPHWVSAERVWRAMQPADPSTGRSRGWLVLRPRAHGVALGFSVRCEGDSWQGLANRLTSIVKELQADADLATLARAVLPLAAHLELRVPSARAHQDGLADARAALRELPAHRQAAAAVGAEQAEAVTLLLLAIADRLGPAQRAALLALSSSDNRALATELSNIRAQLSAVLRHAGPRCEV